MRWCVSLEYHASECFNGDIFIPKNKKSRAPGALVEYSWENTDHLFIALPQFHNVGSENMKHTGASIWRITHEILKIGNRGEGAWDTSE